MGKKYLKQYHTSHECYLNIKVLDTKLTFSYIFFLFWWFLPWQRKWHLMIFLLQTWTTCLYSGVRHHCRYRWQSILAGRCQGVSYTYLFSLHLHQMIFFCRRIDYLEQKLYHAFYAFESLTKRSSAESVCGICGIIPDVLLGDVNGI